MQTPKKEIQTVVKDGRKRATGKEIIQDYLLVWLDETVDENSTDHQNTLKNLRRTVQIIETFQNGDECIKYLSEQKKKVFVVISGKFSQTVIPHIHDKAEVFSIYIFTNKHFIS